MSKFNGNEGRMISLETANEFIQNYENGPALALNLGVKGHYFGRNHILELLNQNGAIGLRMYYGAKTNAENLMEPALVVVAVDEDGNDILTNEKILDFSQPCPPVCSIEGLGS